MANFTKDGKRLYTAEQIQTRFNASFWAEYNLQTEDDSKTGTGAYFGGHVAFYLDGVRISSGAGITHRSSEYINDKAKQKNKPLDKMYHYTGGGAESVRQANKQMIEQESHIAALQAKLDILESIDAGTVGDTSTSHDQAFDNKQEALA